MVNHKKLMVLDANLLYLIGALIFWTIGSYVQSTHLLGGLLITQYVLILLPPVIYAKVKNVSIQETFRLNKISFKHGVIVVMITILTYPVAVFTNALIMTIMSLMGNLNIPALPTASTGSEYLIHMLIISVSAGICEEMFFRGFVLSGYERLGRRKAIVLSAILFGVFHFNLYNLMGPMMLGLVFGYLVIETDSIFAGMIGHMTNNGFAVTLGFLANAASKMVGDIEAGGEVAAGVSTTAVMIGTTILFGIISVITLFIAYRLVKVIRKDRGTMRIQEDEAQPHVRKSEFIPLIIPACLFILVAVLQIREIISLG